MILVYKNTEKLWVEVKSSQAHDGYLRNNP